MRLQAGAPGSGNLAGEVRQGPGMQRTWGDWHQPSIPRQTFILGPFGALGTVTLLGAEPLSQAVQRLELWAPPQKWNLENLGCVLSWVKSLGWHGAGTRGRKLCGAPGEGMGRREVCAPRPHQRTPGLVALPCSTVAADRATSSPA